MSLWIFLEITSSQCNEYCNLLSRKLIRKYNRCHLLRNILNVFHFHLFRERSRQAALWDHLNHQNGNSLSLRLFIVCNYDRDFHTLSNGAIKIGAETNSSTLCQPNERISSHFIVYNELEKDFHFELINFLFIRDIWNQSRVRVWGKNISAFAFND